MADPKIDPQDAFGLLRSFLRHRAFVTEGLALVSTAIERRALVHDMSKLMDDEFAGFSRINAAARVHKFGSPEYSEGMDRERGTIDLHFSRNRHHPERPKLMGEAAERERGSPDDYTYWTAHAAAAMTFLDIIEMVCDWWGARKGYDDSRPWSESVRLNLDAKGKYLSPEQRWLAESVAAFLESPVADPMTRDAMTPEQRETLERMYDVRASRIHHGQGNREIDARERDALSAALRAAPPADAGAPRISRHDMIALLERVRHEVEDREVHSLSCDGGPDGEYMNPCTCAPFNPALALEHVMAELRADAGAPPALVALVQEWQEARRDWDETMWIEPANVNQRGERLQAAARALLAWTPAPPAAPPAETATLPPHVPAIVLRRALNAPNRFKVGDVVTSISTGVTDDGRWEQSITMVERRGQPVEVYGLSATTTPAPPAAPPAVPAEGSCAHPLVVVIGEHCRCAFCRASVSEEAPDAR